MRIDGRYTSVIQTCTKVGKWASALRVFDEALVVLNSSYAPKPPATSGYQKSAQALWVSALEACSSGGQWEKAFQLLEQMRQVYPPLVLNTGAVTAAIGACQLTGQWRRALDLLERAREMGVLRGNYVQPFNLVLGSLSKGGRWEEASELLREMEQSADRTARLRVRAGLPGTSNDGGVDVVDGVDGMEDDDEPSIPAPNLVSYNSVIAACSR